MSLSGRKQLELIRAIAASFDYDTLAHSVRVIGVNLAHIVQQGPMIQVAQELVADRIEKEGLLQLVAQLAAQRTGEQLFADLVQQLLSETGVELNVRPASNDGLQRFVNNKGGFVFFKRVDFLAQSVCQIRYTTGAGEIYGGTGFLIAPDLVLTNYHVVELLLTGDVNPPDVSVVFDHYLEADGITANAGVPYSLQPAKPWLGYSEYSQKDLVYSPNPLKVSDDKLDYAILQLSSPAGVEPIFGKPGVPRGWIEIETNPALPQEDDVLFIIQHPANETLTFAHEQESIIGHNPNRTRTRHRTATQDGSSGAPCFDGRYKLVGLHNGADPNMQRPAEYNQMVPLRAIRAHLVSEGHWAQVEQRIANAPAVPVRVAETDEGPDPHQVYLLPGDHPFLDRVEMRTIAQHLNNSGDRVVTVNGGKDTGKTYTKKFIYYLAKRRAERNQDEFTPIWVDLARRRRGQTKPMTGLRLAVEIVNQIPSLEFPEKYSTSFEENKEQDTVWAENVGSWLTGKLNEDSTVYWIIVDGYTAATLDPSVDHLLDDLIYRVSNTLDTVRLVLLDYDPSNFVDDDVGCHKDDLSDLTEPGNSTKLIKEIGKCLVEVQPDVFGDLQQQQQKERLEDEVNEILKVIDPDRGGQMPELGKKIHEKARSLHG